ncbi:MAG TPA: M3 family oligoendopeptidase [Bacilli bacterium]|nr:MAG: Peptidase family M3 [Tenericutes bacterium ADurb.BinA124]HPX84746.1 M3 family oligoendopeptidase [Bacilli bacterium]
MKFKDYPYKRPNLEEVKQAYEQALKALTSASVLHEVVAAIDSINKVRNTLQTMQALVGARNAIDTTDKFYEDEQNFFDENSPFIAGFEHQLALALHTSPFKQELIKKYGKQLFALIETNLKTFKPEIIEDLQEENKLVTEYTKLTASAKIEFDGKINNLSQMAPYAIAPNRETRKQAETAVMKFFEANEAKYDDIYDKLVKVRTRIAKKLGYENFVEVGYARLGRTDYDSKMVANYRKQVEKDLVPVAVSLFKEKAKRLGIKDLKSYDLGINFASGNPKPQGDRDFLVSQAQKMYHAMSQETGEFIDFMIEHELLDLEAKQGKAGGGFCTYFPDYQSPFIFSNFNGTAGDVDVLTHEAGHAFQVFSSRHFAVPEYYWPTMESAEIHSMSMEFFAWPWIDLFFGKDSDKYKYEHLAGTITFIPYGVAVDEYQHEIYEHPELTPDERKAVWRRIEKKYLPYKVYENPFLEKGTYWFRQGHIFSTAFYYIDYTLAQVCAQQFWILNQKDHEQAWKQYYHLCTLGGSKSFLGLIEAAGLKNPFVDGTVAMIAKELQKFLDNFDQTKLQ